MKMIIYLLFAILLCSCVSNIEISETNESDKTRVQIDSTNTSDPSQPATIEDWEEGNTDEERKIISINPIK